MNNDNFNMVLDKVGELSKEQLATLKHLIAKAEGVSESFKWAVTWEITERASEAFKKMGFNAPILRQDVVRENVTLNNGVEMLWKLFVGSSDANVAPFSNTNARIFVGSSTTAESADQTGVITELGSASMDPGFPEVNGRSAVFQATFAADVANGQWREAAVTNGTGVGSVAINRKVSNMGEKTNAGTITIKTTISALAE